ncbi:uncharacterized protein LOC111341694 [Stylophora pistillata]|uniref:Uncharacterized protein n=1 Tax=Stylophora pistillata TaxID=50429 RepID=A0A2B4RKN0_STYPI|nr:uncharacterized protein LOC111341694 [Stylophora pistillata]PFX16825.1 hypothetical protein AWC38_SpisGene18881 [Stylophora pistillata]
MSTRKYCTSQDQGLSRQSTKTYKAVRQKSNAELGEKLRRLDKEHYTTISKLLNERYTWRTIHYNLQRSGEESSSESDGDSGPEDISHCTVTNEEECQTVEKKVQGALMDNGKKLNYLQLPSIIEESTMISRQRSPKLGRSPLPPLSEHGFPTRVRRNTESNHERPTLTRQRQRSTTLPVGHMPGDRQRKTDLKKISKHDKLTHSEGKRVGDEKSSLNRIQDDNEVKNTTLSWEDQMQGCRYLRPHKRNSTPDFLDMKEIFHVTSDRSTSKND